MKTKDGEDVHLMYGTEYSAGSERASILVNTAKNPWWMLKQEEYYVAPHYVHKQRVSHSYRVRRSKMGDTWVMQLESIEATGYVPVPAWIKDILECVLEHTLNKMIVE